jgi:hypothetical protein
VLGDQLLTQRGIGARRRCWAGSLGRRPPL